MGIATESVMLATGEGQMPCHLARPARGGAFPGVVVVMEAFGLNGQIKAVADRIAGEGYVALAPDLYYGFGSPVVPYADVPKAIECMRKLDQHRVMADVGVVLGYLEARPEVRPNRLGIVGFCMGGTVAIRTAGHHTARIKAAVSLYGGASITDRELLGNITAPVLGLFGAEDELIPLEHVRRLEGTMRQLGKTYDARVYPGAGHGFFCDERASYHAEAASDAWARARAWLHQYLQAPE